jgi:hypothetical protein
MKNSPRNYPSPPSSDTDYDLGDSAVPIRVPAVDERPHDKEQLEEAPLFILVSTYLSYLILIAIGHVRDFFGKIFRAGEYAYLKVQNVCTLRDWLMHTRVTLL